MQEYSINERLSICNKCPIYSNGKCSSKLWINPDTDDVSTNARIGYIRGCGCVIKVKVRNQHNHCIAGKW